MQSGVMPHRDLFGEIPVTWDEVDAWCLAVAGLPPDSWRRRYYLAHWNVPEKIRAAKAAGTFEHIINRYQRPPGAY
jgi:hypothetical protein